MPDSLRTQAGPWCGGLTDTSVVIRASILRSAKTARVIVAEDERLSVNASVHDAVSVWVDPTRSYRHQIATFAPDRRGGFPVFQCAALESRESEKGGRIPWEMSTDSPVRALRATGSLAYSKSTTAAALSRA